MIKVKLDDSVCDLNLSEDNKIGPALSEFLKTIPPHRILTRLNINGNRISAQTPDSIFNESVNSTHEIEIKTADKNIWAATGYDIALSSIERVQKSIIHSAELFRESDKLNGNRLFIQCIEGLERFIEAITITKIAVNLDFNQISVDGILLSNTESDLQQILTSVYSFQEQEDYQGLADKIEYELLTNLSQWGRALNFLRAQRDSNA